MSTSRLQATELTAAGRGGVGVILLEGPGALASVARLARRPLVPLELRLVRLLSGGERDTELLDEALVFAESEQRLELHLHGSPALVARVLQELGAERKEPQVSTLEEAAEEQLSRASSEAAARMLLDQATGALRRTLIGLQELAGERFFAELERLRERARIARVLVVPPMVVIAGPVNAGKSTLFNLLVGRERVLVDAEAGTTRDAVKERALLGAYAVTLVDTAGDRALPETAGEAGLERAGQELARELSRSADVVLLLEPRSARSSAAARREEPGRVQVLESRSDEGATHSSRAFSALADPRGARVLVETVFHRALDLPREPWEEGKGVPFLLGQEAELSRWLQARDEGAARSGLARWLGGGFVDRRGAIA